VSTWYGGRDETCPLGTGGRWEGRKWKCVRDHRRRRRIRTQRQGYGRERGRGNGRDWEGGNLLARREQVTELLLRTKGPISTNKRTDGASARGTADCGDAAAGRAGWRLRQPSKVRTRCARLARVGDVSEMAALRKYGRRDETCPFSTGGGTRRVQSVREGGGEEPARAWRTRAPSAQSAPLASRSPPGRV